MSRAWSARRARSGRKAEILDRLLRHGLPREPGRDPADAAWAGRFRAAMRDLGPGFVLFARHLGSRPDLIPTDAALALLEIGGDDLAATLPPPAPGEDALSRVERELGRPVGEVFAELDPLPDRLGLLWQEHPGRLRGAAPGGGRDDGDDRDPVRVRLRRPGIAWAVAADLGELAHLRPVLPDPLGSRFAPEAFAELVDELRAAVAERLDLRRERISLLRLDEDVVDRDLLAVPPALLELSTPRMAVVRAVGGDPIAEGGGTARRREIARRLHLAWLEQAMVAGHAPLDAEWLELSDGRLAVTGGRSARLEAASAPRLWLYLREVAAHRPEQAYEAIAGELVPVRRDADERRLRQRLRQLVPFRDGGWSDRRDTLAELLVLHWRLVREEGFRPSPALAVLWRGLFEVAVLGRRLEPDHDPLRAALSDLHWLTGFRHLRHLAAPAELGAGLEANLASLLEVPRKLDDLLRIVDGEAGGELGLRLHVAADPEAERRRAALVRAVCLALAMAAVALVAVRLPALGVDPGWAEGAGVAAFSILSVLLLRTITR